jgi:hypothetical protein
MGRGQQRRLDAADADRRLFDSARRLGRPIAEERTDGNDGDSERRRHSGAKEIGPHGTEPGPPRLGLRLKAAEGAGKSRLG